jgi:CelD/BcsL family acetyltransferase involved in cellulose biosynthesis
LQHSTSLYDEVEFENVPQDGVMAVTFIPQLDRHGLCSKVSRGQACPRLAVPNSLDNYLHGCTASVRRRLNQARRLSSTLGNHSLAVVQSREELQEAFRELVRLHQERWNRLGYPGLFAGLRFRPFQDEVINRFLNNGWLWFKTIHMDGQCIAARLGFKFKGCLYDYLSGLDTQSPAAHWRPGLALLVSMIEDAIQCNFRRVDLLRGSETYKLELSSDIPYNWKILILSPGAKHKLRVGLHRIIRLLEFMGSKLILEKQILHVHYREHGLPSFIVRYIAFRSKRVINKVR